MNGKEVIAPTEKRIECQKGLHRLLARANVRGVYLFCPEHRQSHLFTWEELELLRSEFRPVLVKVEQVS